MKSKKGKLIVIDGTDGSGKATQVELLAKTLRHEGHTVKIIDFPEYYKNFFGAFIGHCLTEQYYNFLKVHPKIVSVLYAADRWESSKKTLEWLKKGYVVIANRYVSANQIHQGGKIKSAKKRNVFIKWLDQMEYKVFGIPKPDITLYLSLPVEIVLQLLKNRESSKMKRAYLKKKGRDVAEMDVEHLVNSRRSALWLSGEVKNFIKIECSEKGQILPREEIHEKIYEVIKKIIRS